MRLNKGALFSLGLLLFLPLLPARSYELIDSYLARLGPNDHYNSRGKRLTSAAAVIRQDRANYHKFGLRDPEDENDSVFADIQQRAFLERNLNRGTTAGSAFQTILDGTPLIRVKVYQSHVDVMIVE